MSTSDRASREAERLKVQEALDRTRAAADRNRLGQFATPPELATEIAAYVRALWGPRPEAVRFLDPAVGTGVFYSALLAAFPSSTIAVATGIELDPPIATAARALWGDLGLGVVTGDFTTQPPPAPEERYNLVIANPPYVRHHHLSPEEKARLRAASRGVLAREVNGLAGLYCYFMLLADLWMAEKGLATWLVPAEFMDVNYGAALRYYLTHRVKLRRLHQFDPATSLFGDALVSSAVVVFEKSAPDPNAEVELTYGGSLLRPLHRTKVVRSEFRRVSKWNGWLRTHRHRPRPSADQSTHPLASFFRIKRGVATGANGFFILPRQEAQALGIAETFARPILPSPRHLRQTIIGSDETGYPLIQPQLALIDTDLPEERLKGECPQLWAYLQAGQAQGLPARYLLRSRDPWYRQEQRDPAPFLCTYMGRTGKRESPFRFIWNQSRAIATNVYLLLYPIGVLKQALSAQPGIAERVWSYLQAIGPGDLVHEGRVYGGGLYKMEPSELGRISAASLVDFLDLPAIPPHQFALPL